MGFSGLAYAAGDKLEEMSQSNQNWVMPGKNYKSNNYSTLKQINTGNVKELRPAWTFLDRRAQRPRRRAARRRRDDVHPRRVPEFDLRAEARRPDARIQWQDKPRQNPAARAVACCDVVNRGLAYWPGDGKSPPLILKTLLDGHIEALDAKTGQLAWKMENSDIKVTAPKMPPTSLDLRNTATGEKLDFSYAKPDGADTPGLAKFFQTGHDPYLEDKSCLKIGESLFLTSCSGCHGQTGEGKIGPGLNDSYWTYPKNTTDQGLFETVYGGANGQMGPHYQDLTLDQMLQVMAWVRHLYKDDAKDAPWFSDEQKKTYKPYKLGEKFGTKPPGMCAADAAKLAGN